MVESRTQQPRRHLLTVALEDYYHVGAFNQLIQRGQWYRFERRLERSVQATLDLLGEHDLQATFFVLGWVADNAPDVVRAVVERGHEVASKGYYHRSIRQMTPGEFREDLARSREAIERASGRRVHGYRVADRWLEPGDLWALDVLAEEGYAYDSSIAPILRGYAAEPWRRFAHTHKHHGRTLWEFPISSASFFGLELPIAGGNWFRQLPTGLVQRAVAHWDARYPAPFVMYFHTWELDPDQPKINAAPFVQRVRQYRNLRKMPGILRGYFERYPLTSIAEHLGLPLDATASSAAVLPAPSEARWRPTPPPAESPWVSAASGAHAARSPVTIVVPCYNEELILPYLANTLESVSVRLGARYDVRYLFVDDRSTDGTWDALHQIFGGREDCTIIRHDVNRGVAAAIMSGIRHASTAIVCSIDCDCTYDPHELGRMIPLLEPDVDLVTASPYHPQGGVRNVPEWRLFLSRRLSALYRLVLRHKLHTYTSCFRVYRRSAMLGVQVQRSGFLGVAEMLGRLDLAGARIVEFPTTLEVRMLGRSKMKILRTILGHLGLLVRLARLRGRARPAAPQAEPAPDPLSTRARV